MSTYLTSKADDIQNKARELKSTATTQSTIELGSTENTDLDAGGNAQNKLQNKATELQTKANLLYTAAEGIVSAATGQSPLQPLQGPATALKTAAGNASSNGGLFGAAQELAKVRAGEPAQSQADGVIEAFDKVETKYNDLIAKATEKGVTNDSNVIAVVKTYHDVKTTYYQTIIRFRIKKKATLFHGAASQLKTQAASAGEAQTDTPLKKLHTNAKREMTTLVQKAQDLQGIELGTAHEANIVKNYLAVVDKYKALAAKPQFTEASSVPLVQDVKTTFESLKKSYENVLKLRVQELSNLAQTLNQKATALGSVQGLTVQAKALATAAMGGSDGLQQKATELVKAINSTNGDTGGTKADHVIKQFGTVTDKYNDLASQPTYQDLLKAALAKGPSQLSGDELNVKNVEDAYTNLKALYDQILNVTKIKHYATQVETKAPLIASSGAKPSEVKTLIDKLKNVYDSIPGDQADIKSTVENDFDPLKNVVYGVHLDKKCIRYFSIFWTLCNL